MTEDLGLNVHEWKYRISDPAIGRFWQIDPLAEDYMYNGTYNFSENRVIDSVELEGLERIYAADGKFIDQVGESNEVRVMKHDDGNAQDLINTANNTELSSEERAKASNLLNNNSFHGFDNETEAAFSFAKEHNAESIAIDKEMGSAIFHVSLTDADGNIEKTVSILSPMVIGEENSVSIVDTENSLSVQDFGGESKSIKMPGVLAGYVHTHARGNNDFSRGGGGLFSTDESISRHKGVPVYMSNKRGQVKMLDYKTDTDHTFRSKVPTAK